MWSIPIYMIRWMEKLDIFCLDIISFFGVFLSNYSKKCILDTITLHFLGHFCQITPFCPDKICPNSLTQDQLSSYLRLNDIDACCDILIHNNIYSCKHLLWRINWVGYYQTIVNLIWWVNFYQFTLTISIVKLGQFFYGQYGLIMNWLVSN